jgi:hypothetical protein
MESRQGCQKAIVACSEILCRCLLTEHEGNPGKESQYHLEPIVSQ